MSRDSLYTRFIAALALFFAASIAYQAISHLAPETDMPDTSHSVLEKHRDRLIDRLGDIAHAIKNAG